ncbi:SprT family zinc-dependent metalloprotease [Halobacteriovorax sp. JY17]|uniref:M48 family metallopeptidase n=1 Tax=Halobacteriovorax sp. JY17 TaxID=2014617 RepID=UPI000C6837C4|nr:SprT family zinc-dependent metalloprotease [Halobacteriovorax sp. JY17]PIK13548.1 MAG: metal-dependent hydrolase [Halobacteriovorax sp. JY17]
MSEIIKLGEIEVQVTFKKIKNIHLSVMPPNGDVTVSAPERIDLDMIRMYCISRLGWIKKERKPFLEQERETPREFIYNESHYLFGRRYKLDIIEAYSDVPYIVKHSQIVLYVKKNSTLEDRQKVMEACYRIELKRVLDELVDKWKSIIGVELHEYKIKKMSTKWGSCNQKDKRLWFSLELAKKPVECVEYVVAHELIHLIERSHNNRFFELLDKHFPRWAKYKDELNELPLGNL